MSDAKTPCESCSMPIESGPYCRYCTDEEGNLQSFEDRFAAMTQWVQGRSPDLPPEETEARTLEFMAGMPAWRDHPRVRGRRPRE